jgi:hypothetical protein
MLKNVREQGALTSYQAEREGLVRIAGKRREASKKHSHAVECRKRVRQDTKRKKAREGHSLPVKDKGKDKLGLSKNKKCKQGALTSYHIWREGKSGHRNEASEQECSLPIMQRGREKSSTKKSEGARGTHNLSSPKGRKIQDIKREMAS